MSNMVQGKVVVVTGAGAGIGREFAKAFAAHGAKVVVNDISRVPDTTEYRADRVVEEIKGACGEAVSAVESVADPAAAERIIQAAVDHFGRIDCVIHNAGVTRDRFSDAGANVTGQIFGVW